MLAKLTKPARDRLSATKFAFPTQRKELLETLPTCAMRSHASIR
jgi:hypothetical protein